MLLELAQGLATQIEAAGVTAVLDPRGFNPRGVCALVQPPAFDVKGGPGGKTLLALTFPVQVAAAGPANLQALERLYAAVDLLNSALDVQAGRPVTVTVGEQTFPGYELSVAITAHD